MTPTAPTAAPCDDDHCGHQEFRHIDGGRCRMLACRCRAFKGDATRARQTETPALSREERDQMILRLRKAGASIMQISERADCSHSTVNDVIRAAGLTKPRKRRAA